MSPGRIAPSALSRPAVSLARLTFISLRRSLSLIATGASEVVSVPPAMPDVDLAERDLVGDLDRRLQPGAAGLLDVVGGRLGCEPRAEHALAGQVEVARVLEHRAGHDLAEPLAPQLEPVDQAVDGGGQHLLVGDAGVDGVGAGERDAVAADDGDRAGGGLHVPILAGESPPANGLRGTSRKVDSELHTRYTSTRPSRPTSEEGTPRP